MLALNSPISFQEPRWLWLLAVIPVMAAASLHFLRSIEKPRRIMAILLRSLVIAALAAALARIEWVRRNDRVAVMFVLDRSRSVPDELQEKARKYIREVTRRGDRDDRVAVIGVDGRADVSVIPSRPGFDITSFGLPGEPDRTDLAAGLRLAMAAFPEGFARRVVLLSDGNQNSGSLSEEVQNAAASGVSIDVIPLQYRHENEILFDRIVVPAHAGQDSKVPVRMVLKSQRPAKVRISLYHNGEEVPLAEPVQTLSGGMQPDPFTVPVEVQSGWVHKFDARVQPLEASDDSISENNQATAFTFMDTKGGVLLLTRKPDEDRVLAQALTREKIDVKLKMPDEVNFDLADLQGYGVIILSNISADTFNTDQHKALASYVRDFGGGLIMTGGDESFGAGGWIGKPIEEVSPVNFEIKHKRQMPRGALAVIMHSCEAPDANAWGDEVAASAVGSLSSLDYVGVMAYSWTARGPNWEVPLQLAKDKAAIAAKIRTMQVGDMPDFDTTMRSAVQDLMKLKDASQRHMIIVSDGDPAPPSASTIKSMVDNRITCSTVGIGYGAHVFVQNLEPIAKKTGGNYYPVKNPKKVPQIFMKEARVVKRALIENQEFSPALTTAFDELTTGLTGRMPPLGGLVLTERKPDALVPIIRHGTDAGEKIEDPVLAHWHYQMGKMAVFTSGWWQHWGADWSGWGNFGKFWAQIVRWAMHDEGAANFDITTRLDGNRGRVVVEALNKDASYLNFLQIKGRLVTPGMESRDLYLTQTGPGRYEMEFEVGDHGNYLVSMSYSGPDIQGGMVRTGLSVPYSSEFRETGTNFALLQDAMTRSKGRQLAMDPVKDQVFSRNLPPAIARQPMWRWVVQWLLLPLFLLDVAARRLASTVATSIYVEVAVFVMALAATWQPGGSLPGLVFSLLLAELVGWAIRWQSIGPALAFLTASVRGLSRAGQRSAGSLSRLKDVRERIREEKTAAPGAEPIEPKRPRTIALEPAATRGRKFDVGDQQGGRPAADLTESLGGARATGPDSGGTGKSAAGPAGGGLADRLKRAKQRAQDQIKEKNDPGSGP
jgi:uncharacterized membrane protein/Mg-chelatase subunit ChlD